MTKIKEFAIGTLVLLAFVAVLKFLVFPSKGYLVPAIDNDGMVQGFSYHEDSWWGLVHTEYAAKIVPGGARYHKSDAKPNEMVPEEAFEIY